jgi:hypothetical protein
MPAFCSGSSPKCDLAGTNHTTRLAWVAGVGPKSASRDTPRGEISPASRAQELGTVGEIISEWLPASFWEARAANPQAHAITEALQAFPMTEGTFFAPKADRFFSVRWDPF